MWSAWSLCDCAWITGYSELIVWKDCNFRIADKPGVVDLQPTLRRLWRVTRRRREEPPDGVSAVDLLEYPALQTGRLIFSAPSSPLWLGQNGGRESVRHTITAVGPNWQDLVSTGGACRAADIVPEIGSNVADRGAPVRSSRGDPHGRGESAPAIHRLHPEGIYQRVCRSHPEHASTNAFNALRVGSSIGFLALVVDDIDAAIRPNIHHRPPALDSRIRYRRGYRGWCAPSQTLVV